MNIKGFSILVSIGQFAPIKVSKFEHSLRFCFGWTAISFVTLDLEKVITFLVKELKPEEK